jgi:hydrogenase/urease accessory protein HupE
MGAGDPRGEGRVKAALRRIGLGLLLFLAWVASAWSHVGGSTGYASITVSRSTVRYTLTLPTAVLPPDLAEALRLAQAGSPQNRDKLLDLLRRQIVLRANGTRCEPGPGQVVPSAFDATSFTMQLDFACGSAVRDLVVEDNIFDVLGPDHHTLAKVETDGETRELAFAPESREARVPIGARTAGRAETSFFKLGVEHILTGYDHLLFLGALLLRGGAFLSLLKIITAFTVAHSITLALAVLGVVTIPGRIVEPAIAASIVWVALENLLRKDAPSQRWVVSFFFGLVHGFGFASAIEPLKLPAGRLALALLGFNLGVETGQAFVVVLLLPLLLWMRGSAWEPRIVRAASLGVAAFGLVWLVERLVSS